MSPSAICLPELRLSSYQLLYIFSFLLRWSPAVRREERSSDPQVCVPLPLTTVGDPVTECEHIQKTGKKTW